MSGDTQVEKGHSPLRYDGGNGLEAGQGNLGLSIALQVAAGAMQQLADEMAAERERHQRLNQAIHPFDIPPNQITLSGGAGTLNVPNLYGPQISNYWAVERIACGGFTAGTVTVYLNAVGAEVLAVFNPVSGVSPPPQYFGTGQITLGGNDAMVFSATGITGTVTVSLGGTEIAAEWIGDFLL